ncbi:peptidoglycan editing factor PgeF [Amphibacillus sp. Q70]|uniref:peptidoglycan editing factor PgeF n=1 Tax=Amphibacillus sp. Q70 TaxID=3453416 RepID=UPI003F87F032
MEPFQSSHASYKQIKSWANMFPEITAGITTRLGGRSKSPYDTFNMGLHVNDVEADVVENRMKLADLIGFPLERWCLGEQVHGTNIARLSKNDANIGAGSMPVYPAIRGIDGLMTKERDILIAAFFADCVPLFFYDPVSGWIGIAHAGWRGTVNGIAVEMIKELAEEGVNPDNLFITIGPSISFARYQVNQDVIKHIPATYRNKVSHKIAHNGDQYLLDLKKLNQYMLIDQGVNAAKLLVTEQCTYDHSEFYSHRRDQGRTGRMLGFIGRH